MILITLQYQFGCDDYYPIMIQSLDKNSIKESIAKAKAQDILYLTVDSADKNSIKTVITNIEKFISTKGVFSITIVRKS